MKHSTLNIFARRGLAIGSGLLVLSTLRLNAMVRWERLLSSNDELLVIGGVALGGLLVVLGAYAEQQPAPPAITPVIPPVASTTLSIAANEVPAHLEKTLAEIAVLAWKIERRAQKEPNPPKPILRNAALIIKMLGNHKFDIVSYEGRRIFDGSDVDVFEAIEDVEEDKVVEQHEPEIQIKGKLVRKALLSVGKKGKTASPPSAPPTESPATNQPANPDNAKQP